MKIMKIHQKDKMLSVVVADEKREVMKMSISTVEENHMVPEKSMLNNYQTLSSPETVLLRDGATAEAVGAGDLKTRILSGDGDSYSATLTGVVHVPSISANVFSVLAAARNGKPVHFDQKKCWVKSPAGRVMPLGAFNGQQYEMSCEDPRRSEMRMSQAESLSQLSKMRQKTVLETLLAKEDVPVNAAAVARVAVPEKRQRCKHAAETQPDIPESHVLTQAVNTKPDGGLKKMITAYLRNIVTCCKVKTEPAVT